MSPSPLDLLEVWLRGIIRSELAAHQPQPQPQPEASSLLTAAEMAQRLGVHPVTLRRWARWPGFPVRRIGPSLRFDPGDVMAHLIGRKSQVTRDK